MSENTREDFLSDRLEYTNIALISSKTRVLIVGGGRAGFIKAKSFSTKGCDVYVVSKEFDSDFQQLIDMKNINIIKEEYSSNFIIDKHLVVIAISDDDLRRKILEDCEKAFKLCLDCTNFKAGNFVMPVQRQTESAAFSLNTKGGSPRAAILLASVVEERLKEYDGFINYICMVRDAIKEVEGKDKILSFIATEDFKFFYEKGKAEEILKMFI